MTQILSRTAPAFDISSASFRRSAGDLGEVIALLAGGARPDPETLSRLCISLRTLQGFLLEEAHQQEQREALAAAVAAIDHCAPIPMHHEGTPIVFVSPYQAQVQSREEIDEGRRLRASA